MLNFESVKQRLGRPQPFSFLEFNYILLQSYDFLQLWRSHKAQLQIGGSDQWGNIVSGIELGRKADRAQLFGLTAPLITTSDGKKMGKSEGGAIWLNSDLLSEYVSCYTIVLPSFSCCDGLLVSLSLNCLPAFSDTTWDESNHHLLLNQSSIDTILRLLDTSQVRLLAVLAQHGGLRRDTLLQALHGATAAADRGDGALGRSRLEQGQAGTYSVIPCSSSLPFLVPRWSLSLLSIYCCLSAFSETTRHESNHHPIPPSINPSTQC
jgi:hypothetical protein